MARQKVSLGLFGIFGRSHELRELDDAFRAIDVHPRLVPDAVKLTIVGLLKDHAPDGKVTAQDARAAALLVGYCMVGAQPFSDANGSELVHGVEKRIEAALEAEDDLDAKLVLLALHARIVQPGVIDRYGLESVAGE